MDGTETCDVNQPNGNNSRRSKRVALVASTCVISAVVAFGLVGCGESTTASVPDVKGDSYARAVQAISNSSDQWKAKKSTSNGKMVALLRMHSAGHASANESDDDLVVASTQPKAGVVLDKTTKQTIKLNMQPPEDELDQLKKARSKALKVKSVTKRMKKNGWGKRSIKDYGTYVVYRWTALKATSDGVYDAMPSDFVKQNKGLYKKAAKRLGSSVITLGYTKDGYLAGVFVDWYPKATKSERKQVRKQVKAITDKADKYASNHAKRYLKKVVNKWKKNDSDSNATGDYLLTRRHATIYFKTSFDNPAWSGDAAQVDETRTYYKVFAKWSAQMLRRNVTVKFLNSSGEVWDSFSAKCQKWPKVS